MRSKCYMHPKAEAVFACHDCIESERQEITKLRARVERLTKAIDSTVDYIDGVHTSECDSYGTCSNCSIRFELEALKESDQK